MIKITAHCRRLLLSWVYRRQCICRVASLTSEGCRHKSRQHEIQMSRPRKSFAQLRFRDDRPGSSTEHKQSSMVGFDMDYPACGIESSVTKYRFENNKEVELCDEWNYAVHYLKLVLNSFEASLNDLSASSAEQVASLNWYARPYHYTTDDIVDLRRIQTPDESIYSRSTVHGATLRETCGDMSPKCGEQPDAAVDISTNTFHSPHVSNVGTSNSLDKFLASTALAICDIVQFRCDCGISRDLPWHNQPDELLPYLDANPICNRLQTRLDQSLNTHMLHCEKVSCQQLLDSFGLLHLESSRDTQLLAAGSSSSLTPDGSEDKQKLPNIDQLRVIQDNLAYNMPKLLTSGHEYQIYTEDVLFENSWFPSCTYTARGQTMYSLEIARLRFFIHIRLANIRIQLLKTTSHPEDGSVRVRWRVVGIPITHAVKFWNFLPWTKRHTGSDNTQWLDGFSTFYVGENGLVYKHKMDRIIPDDGIELTTKKGVIEKLVGITSPAATT